VCGPEVPDLPRDTPAPTGPPPTREADPVNSPDGRRRVLTRLLAALGLAWGAALLARPQWVVDAVDPVFPRARLWVARLLGARLVAEHAALLIAPEPPVVRLASAVELVHAASMVPVLLLPRYRRAAWLSGGIAAACAGVLPALRAGIRD
jgi:hypothetical protein